MREIRTSGSVGGSTGPFGDRWPYPDLPASDVEGAIAVYSDLEPSEEACRSAGVCATGRFETARAGENRTPCLRECGAGRQVWERGMVMY